MPTCANHPDIIDNLTSCSRCGGSFCSNCIITLQGKAVCAGCKTERVKDIVSGADVGLDLASRGARLGGAIIDGVVFMIAYAPFMILPYVVDDLKGSIAYSIISQFIFAGIATTYEALMLQRFGRTLGKMAVGTAVVAADGSPLPSGKCWNRGIIRNLLAITQIGGLIDALMIFGKDRLTLHDRTARSRVVNWKR